MRETLRVTMPDNTTWDIPVDVIARNRAEHYAHRFNGDIEESLKRDTIPLFEKDIAKIIDWACNNMNWEHVKDHAKKVSDGEAPDYDMDWPEADKDIL